MSVTSPRPPRQITLYTRGRYVEIPVLAARRATGGLPVRRSNDAQSRPPSRFLAASIRYHSRDFAAGVARIGGAPTQLGRSRLPTSVRHADAVSLFAAAGRSLSRDWTHWAGVFGSRRVRQCVRLGHPRPKSFQGRRSVPGAFPCLPCSVCHRLLGHGSGSLDKSVADRLAAVALPRRRTPDSARPLPP